MVKNKDGVLIFVILLKKPTDFLKLGKKNYENFILFEEDPRYDKLKLIGKWMIREQIDIFW